MNIRGVGLGSRVRLIVFGGNALDPTAVPLGDGSYRVYYSATSGNDPFSDFGLSSKKVAWKVTDRKR